MNEPELTLFYDGGCHLCSREIGHYHRHLRGPFRLIDIADPAFDAAAHGVDAAAVHQVMHVKLGDEVRTGVDAFTAIWERVPGWGWLARLARIPGMRAVMSVGYHAFAKVRPLLPRRKAGVCKM